MQQVEAYALHLKIQQNNLNEQKIQNSVVRPIDRKHNRISMQMEKILTSTESYMTSPWGLSRLLPFFA